MGIKRRAWPADHATSACKIATALDGEILCAAAKGENASSQTSGKPFTFGYEPKDQPRRVTRFPLDDGLPEPFRHSNERIALFAPIEISKRLAGVLYT